MRVYSCDASTSPTVSRRSGVPRLEPRSRAIATVQETGRLPRLRASPCRGARAASDPAAGLVPDAQSLAFCRLAQGRWAGVGVFPVADAHAGDAGDHASAGDGDGAALPRAVQEPAGAAG